MKVFKFFGSDLVKVLKKQYSNTLISNLGVVNKNINKISLSDTYTITTGHNYVCFQILFLIYKIVT